MSESKGVVTYYALRTIGSYTPIPGTLSMSYEDAKELKDKRKAVINEDDSLDEVVRVEVTPT